MKAIAYLRVSTQHQTIDSQKDAVLKYASNNGLKISQIIDEQISGVVNADERMGFINVLAILKNEKIKHIIVYELSRIGRNLADILKTIEYFVSEGVDIHIVKDNVKYDNTPSGKLLISMHGAVSEFERNQIKQRTVNGRDTAVASGKWWGGLNYPYGFEVVDKVLIINEEEAEIVRFIFELRAKGVGSTTIANQLNAKGFKTRNQKKGNLTWKRKDMLHQLKWTELSVLRISRNTIYKGQYKFKNIDLKITPIIDENTWFQANDYKKRGAYPRKFHFLNKIDLKCGICDHAMTYKSFLNATFSNLQCHSKHKCDCGAIGELVVNEAVLFLIKNTGIIIQLMNHYKNSNIDDEKIREIDDKKEVIDFEISKLLKMQDNNVMLIQNGLGDVNEIMKTLLFIKNKLVEKNKELDDILIEKANYLKISAKKMDEETLLTFLNKDITFISNVLDKIIEKITFYPMNSDLINENFLVKNNKYKIISIKLLGVESNFDVIVCSRSKYICLGIRIDDFGNIKKYNNKLWRPTIVNNSEINDVYMLNNSFIQTIF